MLHAANADGRVGFSQEAEVSGTRDACQVESQCSAQRLVEMRERVCACVCAHVYACRLQECRGHDLVQHAEV